MLPDLKKEKISNRGCKSEVMTAHQRPESFGAGSDSTSEFSVTPSLYPFNNDY